MSAFWIPIVGDDEGIFYLKATEDFIQRITGRSSLLQSLYNKDTDLKLVSYYDPRPVYAMDEVLTESDIERVIKGEILEAPEKEPKVSHHLDYSANVMCMNYEGNFWWNICKRRSNTTLYTQWITVHDDGIVWELPDDLS